MVENSLYQASTCGNRIAFHGVQIIGMDAFGNEEETMEAVSNWLERHPATTVTLIDKLGHFNRHALPGGQKSC